MSDSKPLDTPATEPVVAAPVSDAAAPATTEAAPVADVPAADAPATTTETPAAAESAAPVADETTALPVEEKKGEDEVKITAEPIYSGSLGYKAPGLLKSLTYSKKFFWFGEEPVTKDSLSAYLRGEKADVGHSTAAWASKTGKGILFFAKNAELKANPAGALKLADASDVTKEGNVAFFFRFHGHKYQFEASSQAERDGWIVSIEKGIEEAKVASEDVTSSEEYKTTIEALAKPATATTGKADESAPKKSTDVKPAEGAERPSSASSSDENAEGKKTAKKNKSRSVSRKRASVFGLLGKKDDKKEVKKEEESKEAAKEEAKEEPKAEAEAAPTTEGAAAEPVAETAADEAKPAEEVTPVEGEAAAEVAAVAAEPEVKPTPTPKANKRTSIFGNFFEKVRSPAAEKKESEVAPTVPPKDNEVVAAPAEEPAVATDAAEPAVAATEPATTEAAEPKPATTPTPAKEKAGFFSKFGKKKEVESPAPAAAAAAETPAVVEAKPEEATTPTVDGEAAAAPAAAPAPKATPEPINKEKRRTSFFGNFVAKGGEADGEKKKGLGGLFRNPSKAVKSNKDKEAAPTKVEEEPETKAEEAKAEDKVEEPKAEENTTEESKPTIGDVVPEAVQATENQATPTVQATA